MSAIRRKFGMRRAAAVTMGSCAVLGVGMTARPAQAASPVYSDIMPLSQVRTGMTGYGLTTFKGTTISRFEVTVLGIMRKANLGHDLIMVRMKGGPITEAGANLIHGMSGSPIYINGKCIGAFSMGEEWPKEPLGMVTPIEDMLEAWDPNIPQNPPYFQPAEKQPTNPSPTDSKKPEGKGQEANGKSASAAAAPAVFSASFPFGLKPDNRERTITLPQPITVGRRRIARLVLNARVDSAAHSAPDVAVMHRATSYATVGGVSDKERAGFQKFLDQRGYAVTLMQAPMPSGKSALPATPLRPGSCFGTFLSTGDVQFGGFGTVTYRKGNRILGFGHPLMTLGALNAAVTTASVLDVFSSVRSSHIDAEAGPVVGTLTQDRNFSVGAELGRQPSQIPFDITVRDETTHRSKTFHSLMFQHPELTAALMGMIGRAAVSQVHNMPGDVMAKVTTTVEAGEVGRITRTNVVFDADDISQPATQDLTEITNIISGNPFYPLPIKRARMTVDLSSGHNTATVERIFLKQGKYEPGDTLDVGVVLKPYRRESIIKNLSIKIPSETPTGRYALLVRGGTASVTRIGPFVISGGSSDPSTPAVNVRQMITRLNAHEANTDMVGRLVLNTGAPALEGEKLSQLPPNLAVLMRSDRNSGVRIERDEVRVTAPTDYVVSGTQQLFVTIQRKNTQEPTGVPTFGGQPTGLPSGSPTSGQPGSGITTSPGGGSLQDDDKDNLISNALSGGGLSSGLANGASNRSVSSASSTPVSDASGLSNVNGGMSLGAFADHWLAVLKASGLEAANAEASAQESGDAPAQNASDASADPQDPANPLQPPTGPTNPPAPGSPANPANPANPVAGGKAPNAGKGDKGKGGKAAAVAPPAAASAAPATPTAADTKPATTPSDNEPVKIVGRQLQVWRQSGASGFASGKFVGTSVTATGELRLAPRLRRLATTNETYIWSVVTDAQGNIYAGTGTGGKILKADASGKVTTFAQLPIVSVQSLLLAHDGSLWAGSSVKGSLYHIKPDGAYTLVATLPEKYILALCEDSKGNVYVGPGGGGNLYKVPAGYAPRDATRADAFAPFVKTPADYITALTVDGADNLYVGTGNEGIVYKITPDGKSSVLYDAKENSVTALALDKSGNLYAGTGPKGLLYRIGADGAATVVYDRATSFYTGLRMANDGTLYATTVNAAYHIFPQSGDARPVVQPLDNPRDVDFLTLALLPDEGVVIGTGNIGELYTSRPENANAPASPDALTEGGTFESVIHDSRLLSRWGTVRWNAILPNGARLRVQTRAGNVAEPDATWSAWQAVAPAGGGEGRIVSPQARFIQYRLALSGGASSGAGGDMGRYAPAVREVSLSYMPRNQAPRVVFASPAGGERWSKTQTVRWNGLDPDGDTLSYDLFYSPDGLNWKPLPSASASSANAASASSVGAGVTASGSLTDTQQRLDAQANIPEPIRRMTLESAQRRREAAGASDASGVSLRETSKAWDTRSLPDGTYWLKVVASDIASNPTDAQTAQAISEPFVIANAVPVLTMGGTPLVGADRRVTLEGSATQSLIPITAVQYRIDGGEWLAAAAKDGLFDSGQEAFALVTSPLKSGKHTIEVAAFNAANAKTVQRVEVSVP